MKWYQALALIVATLAAVTLAAAGTLDAILSSLAEQLL